MNQPTAQQIGEMMDQLFRQFPQGELWIYPSWLDYQKGMRWPRHRKWRRRARFQRGLHAVEPDHRGEAGGDDDPSGD